MADVVSAIIAMTDQLHDLDAVAMRLTDAIAGADPVTAIVALARVTTGLIAGISQTAEQAERGCRAVADDMVRVTVERWADVELLRARPVGTA